MEAGKLLIADSNEDFRLALANSLHGRYYVRCCATGMEAMALLRNEQPDILILDLMLPELDGLTLLERIAAENIRPMVLVVTSMVTDYVFESADRLGIGYVMRKPCDVQAVASRIKDLGRRLYPAVRKQEPENLARELLGRLGLASKYDGYDYLIKAITLMRNDPNQAITKELYPSVAKACGCGSRQIERSIRNAIEKAWEQRDKLVWSQYFPTHTGRPSNGVFILRLTQLLGEIPE